MIRLLKKGYDIIPRLVGTVLLPGDTVVVEEGMVLVTQKTKFMVPIPYKAGIHSKPNDRYLLEEAVIIVLLFSPLPNLSSQHMGR